MAEPATRSPHKTRASEEATYDTNMAAAGSAWCRLAPIIGAALLLVAGCTYTDSEPGLFGQEATRPTSGSSERWDPPSPRPDVESPSSRVNPALPVAGEWVWTTADGSEVQIRLAVHAVRRINGATVLDWSVTPLRGFNLLPGDPLPASIDLGLSRRGEDAPNVLLVDAPRQAVYRPLVRGGAADPQSCLCTPVWMSPSRLRVGVTTLLQVGFPELPAALRTVDVNIATVPQFWRIPITPVGQVPMTTGPTDLTRPADDRPAGVSSAMFRYGASEQVFRVRVHHVLASSTNTSMEWAIVSVTGGDGVEEASTAPFVRRDAATLVDPIPVASGPVLRANGQTLQARLMTGRTSGTASECLCTDLRGWTTVLRRPDKVATVVTNYPVLPEGSDRVAVVFDGLDPLVVPVTPSIYSGTNTAGSMASESKVWPRTTGSLLGWPVSAWPTPVPSGDQVDDYPAVLDRLLR